jgi:hypothetical protein
METVDDLICGSDHDEQDLQDGLDDERETEDDDQIGCCFPGTCCMPVEHFESECHTSEMMEQLNAEFGAP